MLFITPTPNPASSDFKLTTSLTNEIDGIQYEVVADGVALFDDQNTIVISMTPDGTTTNFNTKYMRNGTYYLHVKFGGENFVKRVVVNK